MRQIHETDRNEKSPRAANRSKTAQPKAKINKQLEAALHLLRCRFSVIPLSSPTDDFPLTLVGHDDGKTPLLPWKRFQDVLPSEDEIIRSWRKWPSANIAIVTGLVSGIVVLDVDGPQGEETLAKCPPLPPTWTARTGNGYHYYFAYIDGARTFTRGLPGIDGRGDGGCIVAPPSLHANGRRYEWTVAPWDCDLTPPPPWVRELFLSTPTPGSDAGYRHAAALREGHRNDRIYRLTRSIRAHRFPPHVAREIAALVNERCCKPPLSTSEIRDIVRGAYQQADRAEFLRSAPSVDELIARSLGK